MYPQSGFLRRSALHRDHDHSPHPLPRLGALVQVPQELFRARGRGEKAQSGTCDRVHPLLLALLRPHFGRPSAPLFASTPTLSPPRRCLLYLLPFNSMSARPPPAPGSSTCQVHWPRIAELNETPALGLAILPDRRLHQAFAHAHVRDGPAPSVTCVFHRRLCFCPRLSHASNPPSQAQGAPPQAARKTSFLCACSYRGRRGIDQHHACALAAAPMDPAAGHAVRRQARSRAHPRRVRGSRVSAGRASISCAAIRAQIALLNYASVPRSEPRWVTRGRGAANEGADMLLRCVRWTACMLLA
jgi:hypothetical protein